MSLTSKMIDEDEYNSVRGGLKKMLGKDIYSYMTEFLPDDIFIINKWMVEDEEQQNHKYIIINKTDNGYIRFMSFHLFVNSDWLKVIGNPINRRKVKEDEYGKYISYKGEEGEYIFDSKKLKYNKNSDIYLRRTNVPLITAYKYTY